MMIRFLLLSVLLLVAPCSASAHAIIVTSSPAAHAVVRATSLPMALHFNSRIDHAHSKLTLYAPDGAHRDITPAAGSPQDGLNAQADALSPGAWRLRWQVLSIDGHITRGDIPFTVR